MQSKGLALATMHPRLGYDATYDPMQRFPYLKIDSVFYFGGIKKKIKIPMSMPHRVIIEPNPPR